MSDTHETDGIWQRAKAWIDRRRRVHQLMHDFDGFTAFERSAALHELGLSEDDIPRLAAGHMSSGYVDRMLQDAGVSANALRQTDPELWATLERTCALCPDWHKCDHDFAAHVRLDAVPDYCDNKDQIDALSGRKPATVA